MIYQHMNLIHHYYDYLNPVLFVIVQGRAVSKLQNLWFDPFMYISVYANKCNLFDSLFVFVS